MQKEKYEIGDRVRIVTLKSRWGNMSGVIGHEGVVIEISGTPFYELTPHCKGGSWPAECLELIEIEENYEIY